jgi:hypothetical protein
MNAATPADWIDPGFSAGGPLSVRRRFAQRLGNERRGDQIVRVYT